MNIVCQVGKTSDEGEVEGMNKKEASPSGEGRCVALRCAALRCAALFPSRLVQSPLPLLFSSLALAALVACWAAPNDTSYFGLPARMEASPCTFLFYLREFTHLQVLSTSSWRNNSTATASNKCRAHPHPHPHAAMQLQDTSPRSQD